MIIVLTVALILLVIITSFLSFRMVFYQTREQKARVPDFPETDQYIPYRERMIALYNEIQTIPFEEVRIVSSDSTPLYGRFYKGKEGAPTDIMFHGYRSLSYRDFCAGHKIARDKGHNILLVDQRAHGLSGGNILTFGIKEKEDLLCWVNYVTASSPDAEIYLYGVSMGASTVLAATELRLPENVKGVVADSPYSSPKEIIKKVCRDIKVPVLIAYPFIMLGAFLFGGINLRDGGAKKAVKKAAVPILIIHGIDDRFVPHSMGKEIYDNIPGEKSFLSVKGAGHVTSYFVDTPSYEKAVSDFLNK